MEKKSCPECDGMFTPLKDGGLRAHGPVHARCTQNPANRVGSAACKGCGLAFVVQDDGTLPRHGNGAARECRPLSDPAPTVEAMDDMHCKQGRCTGCCGCSSECTDLPCGQPFKGPWFGAMYDGECSSCDDAIYEGDSIRADGQGGYECEDCEFVGESIAFTAKPSTIPTVGQFMDPAPYGQAGPVFVDEAARFAKTGRLDPLPTPEQFMDPSPVGDAEPVMSVSGQPKKVLRDHLDRYAVVLPGETELEVYKSSGNPVGRTRATTFNKAAQQSKAINDWGKRNVVIGAVRRRDLILQAHDLTHEQHRDKLDQLVKQLEEAAGSKVGSDLGTYLHEFTEYMDAGLKTPDEAPDEFRQSLDNYANALYDAGLEPIRSLIERTTIIREYGWVCGTFDRIFFHRPSGQYVIGDLKTGKTMDYGKNEVECQLWVYAHGVNQNGVYDWNTRTWGTPFHGCECVDHLSNETCRGPRDIKVSESVGVVIHMPVQGPKEGTVELLWADLESGAAHAEVCGQVRARPGGKMKPWGDGPVALRPLTWHEQFAAVRTGEDANRLWRLAKADGVSGLELQELISVAREALSVRG